SLQVPTLGEIRGRPAQNTDRQDPALQAERRAHRMSKPEPATFNLTNRQARRQHGPPSPRRVRPPGAQGKAEHRKDEKNPWSFSTPSIGARPRALPTVSQRKA